MGIIKSLKKQSKDMSSPLRSSSRSKEINPVKNGNMNINTNVKKDDYKNLPNSPLDPKYKNSEEILINTDSRPVQSDNKQFGKKENPNISETTKNTDNFES